MSYPFEFLDLLFAAQRPSRHLEELVNDLDISVYYTSLDELTEPLSDKQSALWLLIENDESSLIAKAKKLVAASQPHLVVLRTGAGGYVGPTYIEPGTACVHCASLRLMSNDAAPKPIEPLLSRKIEDIVWETAVYRELLALRTGQIPILTINHILDCDVFSGKIERRRVLRAPHCPTCRASQLPTFSAWQVDRA